MYANQLNPPDLRKAHTHSQQLLHPVSHEAVGSLAATLEYMRTHLNGPIRIPVLCAMAGFSPSRFFEVFKKTTGDTPLNWFTRARMKLAGQLLVESKAGIKQIAGEVGYEDPYYFSRVFKSVHGVSPSAYRMQHQKETTGEARQSPFSLVANKHTAPGAF